MQVGKVVYESLREHLECVAACAGRFEPSRSVLLSKPDLLSLASMILVNMRTNFSRSSSRQRISGWESLVGRKSARTPLCF